MVVYSAAAKVGMMDSKKVERMDQKRAANWVVGMGWC